MSKEPKKQKLQPSVTCSEGCEDTHNPLGIFGCLPIEIIEHVLCRSSVESLANLAIASRAWNRVIENWLTSTNAKRTLILEILQRVLSALEGPDKNDGLNEIMRSTGVFVRRLAMFSSISEKIKWFIQLADQTDQVADVVLRRMGVRQKLELVLLCPRGHQTISESRLRVTLRNVFLENRLLISAVEILAGSLTAEEQAHLLFILFGPCTADSCIDWQSVVSSKLGIEVLEPLGRFLNTCYQRRLFDVEQCVTALTGIPSQWKNANIASLFAFFSTALCLRSILQPQIMTSKVLRALVMTNANLAVQLMTTLRTAKGGLFKCIVQNVFYHLRYDVLRTRLDILAEMLPLEPVDADNELSRSMERLVNAAETLSKLAETAIAAIPPIPLEID